MALTEAEKAARKRQRMLDKAREYTTGTYMRKFVAPLFQKMIRAESATLSEPALAVVDGELTGVACRVGQCVCITCGKVQAWDSGIKGMHTGHFLASRRNSILLEEDNVAPQCSSCNYYRNGAPQAFRMWMEHVRGQEVIERLEQLKTTVRQFDREELVDLQLQFQRRLDEAVNSMKQYQVGDS